MKKTEILCLCNSTNAYPNHYHTHSQNTVALTNLSIVDMSQNNSNSNTTEGQEINDKPPMTYKEQLDEAAIRVKNPQDNEKEGVVEKVVDKGKRTVHIPASREDGELMPTL